MLERLIVQMLVWKLNKGGARDLWQKVQRAGRGRSREPRVERLRAGHLSRANQEDDQDAVAI